MLLLVGARGQAAYVPDTSLTYADFLRQCQNFTQQQRAEVWVVNFWATWNGASLYTLPQLKGVYEEFQMKPVRFVSISIDKRRTYWEQRLPQYQLPWEQLFLPDENDYAFLKTAFRHNSLPAIFIVSPQGQIRRMRDTDDLRNNLTTLARSLPNEPYRPTNLIVETPPERPRAEVVPAVVVPVEPTDGAWITHTVRKGETLFSLYRRYNVPVADIKRNNALRTDEIKEGQVLKIRRR
ncbi:MAG: hypothetical protein OHK0039_03040 [Bacteroidia bacterium]